MGLRKALRNLKKIYPILDFLKTVYKLRTLENFPYFAWVESTFNSPTRAVRRNGT